MHGLVRGEKTFSAYDLHFTLIRFNFFQIIDDVNKSSVGQPLQLSFAFQVNPIEMSSLRFHAVRISTARLCLQGHVRCVQDINANAGLLLIMWQNLLFLETSPLHSRMPTNHAKWVRLSVAAFGVGRTDRFTV